MSFDLNRVSLTSSYSAHLPDSATTTFKVRSWEKLFNSPIPWYFHHVQQTYCRIAQWKGSRLSRTSLFPGFER